MSRNNTGHVRRSINHFYRSIVRCERIRFEIVSHKMAAHLDPRTSLEQFDLIPFEDKPNDRLKDIRELESSSLTINSRPTSFAGTKSRTFFFSFYTKRTWLPRLIRTFELKSKRKRFRCLLKLPNIFPV